jgi:exopolyphosphatase/guanosine-5'-triphosphate,3'-diphosphate pyrophosphatase
VRIEQMVQPSWQSTEQLESYLRETIRATREILDAEMKLHRIKYVVAVGGDARLAASQVGERMEGGLRKVSLDPFNEFIDYLQGLGIDEIVSNLGVTYNEAEGLVPALLVLGLFAEATFADHLIVPEVSIREGVLVNFALGTNPEMEREFYEQVIASAYNLGKKYHFDESHAAHVAKLSLSLFDQFREDHGMTRHDRMLLETAAILHDIGNFIRATGHHKHGEYIVANSEIFGLSRSDIRIVSNIVRYHRKAMPNASHTNFISMRREHRVAVMKLASILRVGDALDRSHNQRIRDFRVEKSEDNIILYCDYQGDITVEKYGLELKGQMFEEVFGYRVTIM